MPILPPVVKPSFELTPERRLYYKFAEVVSVYAEIKTLQTDAVYPDDELIIEGARDLFDEFFEQLLKIGSLDDKSSYAEMILYYMADDKIKVDLFRLFKQVVDNNDTKFLEHLLTNETYCNHFKDIVADLCEILDPSKHSAEMFEQFSSFGEVKEYHDSPTSRPTFKS
jgi:hypothetical protein